ncbi:hypothetical protein LSTR_LSTR013415 [Laodelphax striatellus]|uniref:Uncharacterized protein n=1 Tax=Laodelphax striatellus TaxID=195883 RepID=A0A482X4B4_LAOST|nr:hypothetical protein LSTR_LSTR013415 [Laodelphax striatellus]
MHLTEDGDALHICSKSPLLSLSNISNTIADQRQPYEENGWSNCDVIPAWTAFTKILSAEEMQSKLNLEPFDEWEEWHLKCNHYALAVARNGTLNDWRPFILNAGCGDVGLAIGFNASQPIKWKLKQYTCIQRYAHTSVLFGKKNKYFLTIGGFGTHDNDPHKRFSDVMCSGYRSQAESCTIRRLIIYEDLCSKGFMHHSCTVVTVDAGDNCEEVNVIVYGGRTSPGKCVNSHPILVNCRVSGGEMFVTSKELLQCVSFHKKPAPRWRHTACIMDIDSVKWFVVFGGCSTGLKILDDLWILRIDESSSVETNWICVSCENHPATNNLLVKYEQKPQARFSHSSAVWKENNMLVTCGLGANNQVFNDVWMWNFESRLWKKMNVDGLILRYGHTSNIINNRLLLVGGVSTICGITPGVAVIDLELLTCHEYRLPALDPSSPVMLHNHSTIYDDKEEALVVVGGGGNCFSFGTHLNSCLVEIPLQQFQI